MAYAKTNWVDGETPITANNLNKIENQLENNTNDIEALIDYSSDEIVIGKWINNKNLYRKIIDIGALPSAAGSKTISTGLNFQSVCVCRKLYGVVVNPNNGVSLPLPFPSTLENTISIALDSSSNILVTVGVDRSNVSGYAVLEYTKNDD